jgi:SP family sugar:H+ symporter-like MFS transporter
MMLIGGAYILPESPRLFLGRGQQERALKSIATLNDCKMDDPLTQEVLEELEDAVREEMKMARLHGSNASVSVP